MVGKNNTYRVKSSIATKACILQNILRLLDLGYLLWFFLSVFAAVFSIEVLRVFSMFPIALPVALPSGSSIAIQQSSNWQFLALSLFCMTCCFTAIWHRGRNCLLEGQQAKNLTAPSWGLLLPMNALCYLLAGTTLYPSAYFAYKQQKRPTPPAIEHRSAIRVAYLLAIFLLLQSTLIFWASGNWSELGTGIQQALQSQIAQQQSSGEDSRTDPRSDRETAAEGAQGSYLGQLIHRIDIWFLSLKGFSSALAIVESSTVELGAIVYGSVSIGKAVAPLRSLLQRLSNILFYGRIVLTAVQIIQGIGEHYGTVLLLALFALAVLEYILLLLQAGLRSALAPSSSSSPSRQPMLVTATEAKTYNLLPNLLQPMQLFAFLRFHLLLLLLLSWCFEPSIQYFDRLLEQVILPQELSQSDQVLQEIQQEYGDIEISQKSGNSWSKLLATVQKWLQNLKEKLQNLGEKLLYFTIMAVIQTIILPFFVLLILFLLYKFLLTVLLKQNT